MQDSSLDDRISHASSIQKQGIEIEQALQQMQEIKPQIARLLEISQTVSSVYDAITEIMGQIATTTRLAHFKPEEIRPWLGHIWARYQTPKQNEIIIALPKFVTYSVGWWDHSDDGYNYYKCNQYTDWLAEVPLDIRKELGLRKPEPLRIEGDTLLATGPISTDVWKRYKSFLSGRKGKNAFSIKPRLKYPLAIQLVKDGILPYSPTPFPKELIEERQFDFTLKPWQEEARQVFRKFSNIGIFAPPGEGKTWAAIRILCDVKPDPPHLVIMKERRLVLQWIERIESLTPLKLGEEVIVETFATALRRRLFEKPWSILVIDETQDLPAKTFSRMAYINCKGRIGITATPFREDEGTEMIFALTGYPFPIPWRESMAARGITPPTINVWFVKDFQGKITKTRELIQEQPELKTFVYSDHIELGKTISKVLDVPFVYGESSPEKGLEILQKNHTVVVSRVGDRGLSFADIERIIEIDFLYGSRQQALQRTGRLLHSKYKTVHHILMTPLEYEKYKKRLMAYEGKGFTIVFPNRRDFQEQLGRRSTISPSLQSGRIGRNNTRHTAQKLAPIASIAPVGPAVFVDLPGMQKLYSTLTEPQQRLIKHLSSRDGEWHSTGKLWPFLGYQTYQGMINSCQLPQLEHRHLIERKTGQIRTNFRGLKE